MWITAVYFIVRMPKAQLPPVEETTRSAQTNASVAEL
jgi:hypothetical protein